MNIDRRAFMGSVMMAAVGCAVGGGDSGLHHGGWFTLSLVDAHDEDMRVVYSRQFSS